MKLSCYKNGTSGIIKTIHCDLQHQKRLLPLGIYVGAKIYVQKQGNTHYPALLYVNGNLVMMRLRDIANIEMEE